MTTPISRSMGTVDSRVPCDVDVWSAMGMCSILSGLFVLSLYVVDLGQSRDHPTTVKRRFLAVSVVSAVAPIGLYMYLRSKLEVLSIKSFASLLGLKWNGLIAATCWPTLLILILYSGPIFQNWIDGNPLLGQDVVIKRVDIILRNYLIAPLAEEWIFRACMLLLLRPAFGDLCGVLVCPIFFGVAHVHHLINWYRSNEGTSFKHACLGVVIQIMYTSIFGLFAGILFVRTNHFISLVICHSLCNMMGLPAVERAVTHPRKYVILLVYFLGAILFFSLLFPLTTSSLYG